MILGVNWLKKSCEWPLQTFFVSVNFVSFFLKVHVPVCPICNQIVKKSLNEDVNQQVSLLHVYVTCICLASLWGCI